jgi:hypothetical protein
VRKEGGLRAVPMGYYLQFLSLLIRLTTQQFADVAHNLSKREGTKRRNRFLVEKRRPHAKRCTRKRRKPHWGETTGFHCPSPGFVVPVSAASERARRRRRARPK